MKRQEESAPDSDTVEIKKSPYWEAEKHLTNMPRAVMGKVCNIEKQMDTDAETQKA